MVVVVVVVNLYPGMGWIDLLAISTFLDCYIACHLVSPSGRVWRPATSFVPRSPLTVYGEPVGFIRAKKCKW